MKRLLDLYCKAGGAAKGYSRAGFEVVGVDIEPQPNYPFEFVRADALEVLAALVDGRDLFEFLGTGENRVSGTWHISDFDGAHASPPCQNDTAYNRRPNHVAPVPELIEPTRELLDQTGLPYVIENVPGAPLRDPVQLCGSSFGLNVRRHRLFECSFSVLVPPCQHETQNGSYPPATNRENPRKTAEIGVWRIPLKDQKRAMGVDWPVTREELSQMIPPAYTEYLGAALLHHIEAERQAVTP